MNKLLGSSQNSKATSGVSTAKKIKIIKMKDRDGNAAKNGVKIP